MRLFPSLVLLAAALTLPAQADEVSDRIDAARAAYDAQDLRTAGAELAAASKAIAEMKSALLAQSLPAAPEGWSQTINTEFQANLAIAGGGTGAEASYAAEDGTTVTVNMMMDSPMLAMMMGMFGNPQMLAMMGKTVEVNGATLLDQDNSLTTVVDNRIMVSISGAPADQLLPFAQGMDFVALAGFDAPK
ncbi:MAG: hypothetical protein MUF74_01920 [Cypionkella sp.]|jgi:hypothetical protein|nr:hypothetical protein [Cypionkella sp.]